MIGHNTSRGFACPPNSVHVLHGFLVLASPLSCDDVASSRAAAAPPAFVFPPSLPYQALFPGMLNPTSGYKAIVIATAVRIDRSSSSGSSSSNNGDTWTQISPRLISSAKHKGGLERKDLRQKTHLFAQLTNR